MRKTGMYILVGMFVTICAFSIGAQAGEGADSSVLSKSGNYNFGDHKSSTLVSKAWAALADNNLDAVLAYTDKCIELYGAEAEKMQAGLTDYVHGSNDMVFKYWALNDVATSYYIQGEAYLGAGKKEEAVASFNKLIQDFRFGQCWDTQGWFWKPADAAQKKMAEASL